MHFRAAQTEITVGQHTQPEPDSLWHLEPVQFTEQCSCGQTSLLGRLAGQRHLGLTGVRAVGQQVHRPSQSCKSPVC